MSKEADTALEVALTLGTILAKQRPAVQGAVLAQLLAMWLHSHPEEQRKTELYAHFMSVQRMVGIFDRGEWTNYLSTPPAPNN